MKTKPAHAPGSDPLNQTLQGHNFNVEAIMANNFGQGDDHTPTDAMNDPALIELFSQRPRRTA
jgi:hypothetical protein